MPWIIIIDFWTISLNLIHISDSYITTTLCLAVHQPYSNVGNWFHAEQIPHKAVQGRRVSGSLHVATAVDGIFNHLNREWNSAKLCSYICAQDTSSTLLNWNSHPLIEGMIVNGKLNRMIQSIAFPLNLMFLLALMDRKDWGTFPEGAKKGSATEKDLAVWESEDNGLSSKVQERGKLKQLFLMPRSFISLVIFCEQQGYRHIHSWLFPSKPKVLPTYMDFTTSLLESHFKERKTCHTHEGLRNAELNFSNMFFFFHSPADNKYLERWIPSFLHWWESSHIVYTQIRSFSCILQTGQADTKNIFFHFAWWEVNKC